MKKIAYNWEVLALTRFLLAMIVLLQHIPAIFHNKYPIMPWFSRFGAFEAVLGFLLISGLSIGNSIQKNQSSFFNRRLQRIYPVYVVSVILHCVVTKNLLSGEFFLIILLNLLFLNQIFTSSSFIVVAWSLSLEVWLYALAPVFYKLSFKTLMILIYISFAAFLIHIAGRTTFHWPYYAGVSYGFNLLLLSFIWVAGFVYSKMPEKRKFLAINVAVFFVIYIALTTVIELLHDIKHGKTGDFYHNELVFYVLQFLTLVIVFIVVFFNHYVINLSIGVKKFFNLLGNISYPLYLTHRSVFIFLNNQKIENLPVAVVSAIIVAFLVYWIFDFYSKKKKIRDTSGVLQQSLHT
ncbi:MAG TPA: acyltransferase [Mucilaginibacter sp.]|jgi:peptidoglycan/LPS O-acetylase OafA/YrhL